ncbi:superkiller protein 3 [Flagelloscypha sp. PMI_526]|nr:superkiller protein 3 [Flagelloscypha sp. PMI_526]
MSLAKQKLKAAREAISKKDYSKAKDNASSALEYDPDNYNAHVFLALAYSELGQLDESEQSYRNAIQLNKDQLLAWQGLSKLYEKAQKWSQYGDSLVELMNLFSVSDDATKCAETYQKLLDLRRNGTRKEIIETLELILPQSRYYSTLSQLPPPDPSNPTATTTAPTQSAIHDSLPVLCEIIDLTEKEERLYFQKEVDKRRTRLGAGLPAQIQKDVGVEVWSDSQLPRFYSDVLNHASTSDELRRDIESRLLLYKQELLFALPTSSPIKSTLAQEVEELASGIVLLKIPDEIAWLLILDLKNASTPGRQLMDTFPNKSLAKLIKGYLAYSGLQEEEIPDDEAYDMILACDAFTVLGSSIFAHRVLAEVYVIETDYSNAIKVVQAGLALVKKSEDDWGRQRGLTRIGFNVVQATSLVHLYPPRHHTRALPLLDDILVQDPDNVLALTGRGYILQSREQWNEAATLFERADTLSDDLEGLRAREEAAWCRSKLDKAIGIEGLKQALPLWESDEDAARCLWRIGVCHFDMLGDTQNECYKFYIQALKRNSGYAPAFTSLGIYYLELASPPDPTRASKCFQKAFELDAREVDAARRLAAGFAEEREWDLVEVVARRTIDGEGGLGAGLDQSQDKGSRFLTANAWAWKALGIVELVNRNYHEAIQSLQTALRAEPGDAVLWLRLGEAYNSSGRQAAALKALEHAKELNSDDWMCSYLLGDVRRQVGQYTDAIDMFSEILRTRPGEVGVLVHLSQTHGFIARAELSFLSALHTSLQVISEHPGFRSVAWKTVGDALFALSRRSSFLHSEEVVTELSTTLTHITPLAGDLATFIPPNPVGGEVIGGLQALECSILAYSMRLSVDASTADSRGSPQYDLGVSLLSWASHMGEDEVKQKKGNDTGSKFLVQALKEDPGNELYWLALGTAKFLHQPKTAQHAYLKALDINPKSAESWSVLGLLYLNHNDADLALEAFLRAQVLDPDAPMPWIGQALIANSQDLSKDSNALFRHATTLNASLQYFSPLRTYTSRYVKNRPDDANGLHLLALISESLGQLQHAEKLAANAISKLESRYEETENPIIEHQFVVATMTSARLKLALGDTSGSLEALESALGLLNEESTSPQDILLRVEGLFLSGVAHFKEGKLNEALQSLESAVQGARDQVELVRQVTVVLAQVLWAAGTSEAQEESKTRLLECITEDPQNLTAITALAAMGLLSEDEGLIDAALSEILSLPRDERRSLDPQDDVSFLLIQNSLSQNDVLKALSVAQTSVFVAPSRTESRNELATLLLQEGEAESALGILFTQADSPAGQTASQESKTVALRSVASAFASSQEESRRLAQRAILLSPSSTVAWKALALAESTSS